MFSILTTESIGFQLYIIEKLLRQHDKDVLDKAEMFLVLLQPLALF